MKSFKCVSNITGELTKYKEIYLIQTKRKDVDTVQLYPLQSVVAPLDFSDPGPLL